MKLVHRYNRKIWGIFILSLITGLFAFSNLPEEIPIHFNEVGDADNFGSRWTIFLAPGINFLTIFLAEGLKKIDPKKEAYKKFEKAYYNVLFFVCVLLWGTQLYTIAYIYNIPINIARIMPVIMGIMFVYIGNLMPKFKHNYFVGIKTSWTLASEKVWYLTHRFAGKVWVVFGILIIFTAFLPLQYISWVFIGVTLLVVLLPVVASYIYYQRVEE